MTTLLSDGPQFRQFSRIIFWTSTRVVPTRAMTLGVDGRQFQRARKPHEATSIAAHQPIVTSPTTIDDIQPANQSAITTKRATTPTGYQRHLPLDVSRRTSAKELMNNLAITTPRPIIAIMADQRMTRCLQYGSPSATSKGQSVKRGDRTSPSANAKAKK